MKQTSEQPPKLKPKQLDLFEALEMLRQAQIDAEVIGKSGEYFELRIRIRSAEEVPSR